jgi:hypothetical protein
MTTGKEGLMNWYWWKRTLGRDHARTWGQRAEVTPPRPRVLLESPDGAEAHSAWSLLARHGYDTMWCPGPTERRECALVEKGRCPLVDRADVIVSALDQSERRCGEVARRLDEVANDPSRPTPMVVVRPSTIADDIASSLLHCHVVHWPLNTKMLLRAVSVVTAGT